MTTKFLQNEGLGLGLGLVTGLHVHHSG